MVVKAKYEDGVFKPLAEVPLKEGTVVEVHLPEDTEKEVRRSVKQFGAYGMWKDRTDFKDGTEYLNRIRKYRRVE